MLHSDDAIEVVRLNCIYRTLSYPKGLIFLSTMKWMPLSYCFIGIRNTGLEIRVGLVLGVCRNKKGRNS